MNGYRKKCIHIIRHAPNPFTISSDAVSLCSCNDAFAALRTSTCVEPAESPCLLAFNLRPGTFISSATPIILALWHGLIAASSATSVEPRLISRADPSSPDCLHLSRSRALQQDVVPTLREIEQGRQLGRGLTLVLGVVVPDGDQVAAVRLYHAGRLGSFFPNVAGLTFPVPMSANKFGTRFTPNCSHSRIVIRPSFGAKSAFPFSNPSLQSA